MGSLIRTKGISKIMIKRLMFLSLSTLLLVGSSSSQTTDANPHKKSGNETLPSIVIAGLDAYKAKGPEEAVRTWIKDSPIDGSREALSQSNSLRQIQDFYGNFQSYEVISIRDLSPRTQVICLVLDYEKGPLFAKFTVYKASQAWILTNFNFNTKEEAILPPQR
ncbi:hypothetical protein [Edaphobacter bradus]|uniref:hypothetical protein n=1 Tax=Edaphobacter bradus TaxID=2259016 RepID=UPI0021E0E1AD|nr:hypothetical protein [Edaphobacter bradus]